MKTIFTILLLFIFTAHTHAQYNNVWCFGRQSGLDFSSAPPQTFTSAIYPDPFNYLFSIACVTVCDSTGKLLFYASPDNVYNGQHQLMPNGSSLLANTPSTANGDGHMSAVGPFDSLYYVFSNANSYFIVNPFYNNGQGYVVKKQISIDSVNIKTNITAVKNTDKPHSYWIVADSDDTLFIYQLDASGLTSLNKYPHSHLTQSGGGVTCQLGASHDGKLLVSCSGADTAMYATKFYHFNNATGQVTGDQSIKLAAYIEPLVTSGPSFVAFSPNDSVIYFAPGSGASFPGHRIIQLNRYNLTQQYYFYSDIGGSIKLGPDGKMYRIKQSTTNNVPTYLTVIHKPNVLGSGCQYTTNGLLVGNMKRVWGLPGGYDEYRRLAFYFYNDCSGAIKLQNVSDTSFFKIFSWYWGDGDSLVGQPFSAIVSHTYAQSGKYLVKLRGSAQYGYTVWFTDTITFVKPPVADFTFKTDTGCQWVQFQFTNLSKADSMAAQGMKWLWHFGDGQTDTIEHAAHAYKKSGNFSVKLVADNGFCADSISKTNSVYILPAPKPGFSATPLYGCAPLHVQVTDTVSFGVSKKEYFFEDSLTWSSQLLSQFARMFIKPGSWKIVQKLTGTTGCITSDSVVVLVREGFGATSKAEFALVTRNGDSTISLFWNKYPGASGYSLLHSRDNGMYLELAYTTDSFAFHKLNGKTMSGENYYKIIPTDSCLNQGASGHYAKPVLLTGEAMANEYSLLTYSPYEYWNMGVKEYKIEAKQADGTFKIIYSTSFATTFRDEDFWKPQSNEKCYRVTAVSNDKPLVVSYSNELCMPYQSLMWVPDAFSPNDDGNNDAYKVVAIAVEKFHLVIYNLWGEQLFETHDCDFSWDGTYKGQNCPAGVYAYTIYGKGMNRKIFNQKGTITLFR